jgi:hypothetical protein
MSISTLLSWSISPYMCLQPPGRSVDSCIEVFWWGITDIAMLHSLNTMLRVRWLPHQPSDGFDDILTPVFDWALVIVIPSHNLESV